MKRTAAYGLIASLTVALIGAGALVAAWLAGTTDGARWLMDTASRHTPLTISARMVEGRLLDRLQLGGVRLALAPVEVTIERLDLQWQSLRLLTGHIAAEELTLTGVQIRDNTPADQPSELVWPQLSGIATFFSGKIGRLQVNGLTYRRPDGQPVLVTTIFSSVVWRNALLSLSDFTVATPDGRVAGEIAAGFSLPSLRFDLEATLAEPIAGMDSLTLYAQLLPGRHPEQLAGGFTAAIVSGKAKHWELTGEAGMTLHAFNMRQLRLTRPGRRGAVTGKGTVTLTAHEPFVDLQLTAAGVDLTPETKVATDLFGTLTFRGTPERYRGEFTMANAGKGWRTARLNGAYEGDGEGVKLSPLNGSLLAGLVQGSLAVDWRKEVSVSGTLRGRNLDPVGISPDWAGVINFDLAGNGAWPRQGPLRWEMSGSLLESRLHGQALTGELLASHQNGEIHIGRLLLKGKGFNINAEGDLGKRLVFDARVGDLGRLIPLPQAAGELWADGWVRWHEGRLDGSLAGKGRNLSADGMRIAAADLTARLGEGKGYPVHISATLRKAAYEDFLAESVTLEADGTALRHAVNAELRSPSAGAEVRIALSGAYSQGSWQGQIVRFSGRDRVGPWNLTAPSALAIAAGRVTLAPLVLTGAEPERLEIAGELNGEPLSGTLRAVWNGIHLARVNPWLTEVRVTGTSAGKVQLNLAEGERPAISGSIGAMGTVTAEKYGINVQQGTLSIDGGIQGMRAGLEIHLAGGGALKGAMSSPAPARLTFPAAADVTAEWTGIDLRLLDRWLPDAVNLEGRLTGRASGKILSGERFDLTGRVSLPRGSLRWKKDREALDIDDLTAELAWGWQGALPLSLADISAGRLVLKGRAGASGVLTLEDRPVRVEEGSFNLEGNERGIQANIGLSLAGRGSLKGGFSSTKPVGLAIPGQGEWNLEWAGIDLLIFRPWLPDAVNLEGRLAGRATGTLLPEQRFEMKGDAALSGGKVSWRLPEGEINAGVRSASLSWEWKGEALRGSTALVLADHGQARGSFLLPIPARFPMALNRTGLVQASLTGGVQEKGFLTTLFPGFIQESRGELDADLQVNGTWNEPKIAGSLKLAGASAYLPTAGIHVKDIQFLLRLDKDLIRIDSFRTTSGSGHIEGTGLVRLKGGQVTGYEGRINGERFQTVYLPELQVLTAPRLTFEGTPKKLAVRGEVHLAELLIAGPPVRAGVLPSKDVIIEGKPRPDDKKFPLALDVQIHLALGEKAFVKMEGIDAQVGGSVELTMQGLDNITSKGEIRVVKGRYRTSGAELEIVRGRLLYTGGPIDQPTLDILALRTVGEVKAGITAGGVLRAPVIKLYSEPTMPEVDILEYIVFGHPLGTTSSSQQAGMVAQVASSLLSQGQSAALQEQIKDRLGLSTLEMQSAESPGRMGYKPIQTSPPGIAPAKSASEASQTLLTVGKYLAPQLYFSYGRSLFTEGNLFRLRYDITKHWQIETQTGSVSGADLYYNIEFN